MMAPSLASQTRLVPLIVVPGMDGARLAFVGGATFEIVGEYPTSEAANTARKAAIEAAALMLAKAGAR